LSGRISLALVAGAIVGIWAVMLLNRALLLLPRLETRNRSTTCKTLIPILINSNI
jgi:hypothetical protein